MTKKLAMLCLVLLAICNAGESLSQSKKFEDVTLRAFGSYIPVPGYMEIIVQERTKDSYEIRILKKPDSEGGLMAIIIERPSQPHTLIGDKLVLVEKYEVNGFSVELYGPNRSEWKSKLLTASVSRCNETGQFIFKEKLQFDQYLMRAPSTDCLH